MSLRSAPADHHHLLFLPPRETLLRDTALRKSIGFLVFFFSLLDDSQSAIRNKCSHCRKSPLKPMLSAT